MYRLPTPDPNDPQPVGRCAKSNFMVPKSELVKQMEFRGDRLVWTGHWVWNRFADQPNPQLRATHIQPDPPPSYPVLPDHDVSGDDWVGVKGPDESVALLAVGLTAWGTEYVLLWK